MSEVEKFTPEWAEAHEGCWFEGASLRTADELNAAILSEAVAVGFDAPQDAVEISERVDGWLDDPDDAEWLTEQADRAIDFLNGLLPDGWAFQLDDGLYLWRIDEDDTFE